MLEIQTTRSSNLLGHGVIVCTQSRYRRRYSPVRRRLWRQDWRCSCRCSAQNRCVHAMHDGRHGIKPGGGAGGLFADTQRAGAAQVNPMSLRAKSGCHAVAETIVPYILVANPEIT